MALALDDLQQTDNIFANLATKKCVLHTVTIFLARVGFNMDNNEDLIAHQRHSLGHSALFTIIANIVQPTKKK